MTDKCYCENETCPFKNECGRYFRTHLPQNANETIWVAPFVTKGEITKPCEFYKPLEEKAQ